MMPPPPPPPPTPGVRWFVGTAYRLAAGHLGRLFRATVPALVPVCLVVPALWTVAGGDRAAIVDGVPLLDGGGRHHLPATLAALLVALVGWCVAMVAGQAALVAEPPARRMWGRWGRAGAGTASLLGLCVVLGGAGLVVVVGPLLRILPPRLAVVLLGAALLAGLLALCRVALTLSAIGLDGLGTGPAVDRALAASRGRPWRTSLGVLVGAGLLPVLALVGTAALADAVTGGLAAVAATPVAAGLPALLYTLVLAVVMPVQAATLAVGYLGPERIELVRHTAVPSASESAGRSTHRLGRLGLVVALLAPAGLAVVVTVVNPYQVPAVRTGHLAPPGLLLAVGLPTGAPPVLVDSAGIVDCADAGCHSARTHTDSTVMAAGGVRAATVTPDGTVWYATADPGRGPSADTRLRLFRCTRTGRCDESPSSYAWPGAGPQPAHLAVAVGPTGAPTVAAILDGGAGQDELAGYPCADAGCGSRAEVLFGRVPGGDRIVVPTDGPRFRPPLVLSVDTAGRPVVGYRAPDGGTWLGTCESPRCGEPRSRQLAPGGLLDDLPVPAGPGVDRSGSATVPGVPGTPGGVGVAVAPDGAPVLLDETRGTPRLWRCAEPRCAEDRLWPAPVSGWPGLVVTTDGRALIGPVADPTERSAGEIRFGPATVRVGPAAPDPPGRMVFWVCPLDDCANGRLVRLHRATPAGPVALASSADGRLLLVQADGTGYQVASLRLPD
ncbi:hypothetical protein [Plantactinospora sp. B24E8]|uniref:hypothetical protein n=1 Tax=Plantactinospora sp. B24E8 TaxID=3153567 RepID=UPI00325DC72C